MYPSGSRRFAIFMLNDFDERDMTVVGILHDKIQIFIGKCFALFGDVFKLIDHPAVDRGIGVRCLVIFIAEVGQHILKIGSTARQIFMVAGFPALLNNTVVLVPDFTDQFLQHILQCYNAQCAAVFICYDCDM